MLWDLLAGRGVSGRGFGSGRGGRRGEGVPAALDLTDGTVALVEELADDSTGLVHEVNRLGNVPACEDSGGDLVGIEPALRCGGETGEDALLDAIGLGLAGSLGRVLVLLGLGRGLGLRGGLGLLVGGDGGIGSGEAGLEGLTGDGLGGVEEGKLILELQPLELVDEGGVLGLHVIVFLSFWYRKLWSVYAEVTVVCFCSLRRLDHLSVSFLGCSAILVSRLLCDITWGGYTYSRFPKYFCRMHFRCGE